MYRNVQSLPTILAVLAICSTVGGCGGGSSSSAVGSPVGVAPAPAPSLSPSPTPTQTTTPTPTPARFLGASPGEVLVGKMACARDSVVDHDVQGRVTALRSLSGAKIDNSLQLTYRSADSYFLDVNGFGGSAFAPADKVASTDRVYSQFLNPTQGEFDIFKDGNAFGTRTFTTIGLDNSSGLCFFAVGRPADSLPQVAADVHDLTVDGVGRIGDQTLRLFSTGGRMTVNTQVQDVEFELRLTGRDDPFGDFTARPTKEITSAKVTLRYDGRGSFGLSALTATNGYTGSITGFFTTPRANAVGGGGAGAVFTFELRNTQGDILFGAIASEANRI